MKPGSAPGRPPRLDRGLKILFGMPQMTFLGHPVHPILITVPVGLLPFSLAMDAGFLVTKRKGFADAAFYSLVSGTVGGLAAGVAGAADYSQIPSASRSRRIGAVHGLLNVSLLVLSALNIWQRAKSRKRSGAVPLALSSVANAGLFVSSWYGAHLIYEHGMRVKGRSEIEQSPELKIPGDERVALGLDRMVA